MDPHSPDTLENRLLDAVIQGDLKKIDEYINQGADMSFQLDAPATVAAHHGQLEALKLLHQRGANLHDFEEYLLRKAASEGHNHVVTYLVENGADVHAMNDLALQWAARAERESTVQLLIEKGADYRHLDADIQEQCAEIKQRLDAEEQKRVSEDRARKAADSRDNHRNFRSFLRKRNGPGSR